MWPLLVAIRVVRAACPEPVSISDLDARTAEVQEAFDQVQAGAMVSAADQAAKALPCVDAVLTSRSAAAYLRARGLVLFYGGDVAAAEGYFASARLADPSFHFTEEQAPNGGKLAAAYVARSVADARPEPVHVGPGAELYVNGERRDARPPGVPVIAQERRDGRVAWTALVGAGEAFPGPPAVVVAPPPAPPPRRRGRPGAVALGIASAATAGAGAGLWLLTERQIATTCFGGVFEGCDEDNTATFGLRRKLAPALVVTGGVGLGVAVVWAAVPGGTRLSVQGRW